jgi:hypothetical protein
MGKPIYCILIPLESGEPGHPIAPAPPEVWPPPVYPDQGLPGGRPPHVGGGPAWGGFPPHVGGGPAWGGLPGHPSHGLPLPGRPVDPGYGVGGGEHPGHGLPSIPPGFPGHLPSIPGAPDQGLPPHVSPPIWLPESGEKPDQGLPPQPPGSIWPPIGGVPTPENGFILAYIPGVGYRYIKVSLKPDQGLPPGAAAPKR